MPSRVPLPKIRTAVYDVLLRRAPSVVLEVLGSAYVSLARREPCRVRREAGYWIHEYRSLRVVTRELGGLAPAGIRAKVHDEFLHEYVPSPGDVVIDVGAGTGAETLIMARLVGPSGRVLAVEAHPHILCCLSRAAELNALDHVETLGVAVSDRAGKLAISDRTDHVTNSVMDETARGYTVRAQTLDAIAQEHGLVRIDFLKMNIEGAEAKALAGMTDLVERTDHLAIACHDFLANNEDDPRRTKDHVEEFLRTRGFDLVTRDEDARPWVRDTLYASRRASAPQRNG